MAVSVGSRRRGIAITTLGNTASPLAGLISAPILAQALGVAGRGEAAAATAPLLLAVGMLTLGLPEAVTYYVSRRPTAWKGIVPRAIALLILCGLAGIVGVYALAMTLAGGDAELAQLINLAALALVPALVTAGLRAAAAGLKLWGLIAAERFTGSVSRLAAISLLALTQSLTVLSGTITLAATVFLGGLVYLLIPYQLRKRILEGESSAPERVALLSYGLRMWVGALTGILLTRLNQTLMVPLASTYELGLFVVAVAISEVVLVFNGAVRDVTFSTESGRPDADRLAFSARVSTLVTLIAAIGVGVAAIWGIPFLFGSSFSPALAATHVMLLGAVLGNPGSVAGAGLSARGRPGLRSWSMAIAVIASVGLTFIFVPTYGALGAAIASFGGSIVASSLNLVWLKLFFGMKIRDFVSIRQSDFVYLFTLTRVTSVKLRAR